MSNTIQNSITRLRAAGYEVIPPKNDLSGASGFAERLQKLRSTHGWSLQTLADKVGVSKAHLWELEKGRTCNPTAETLFNLASIFRVDATELYLGATS